MNRNKRNRSIYTFFVLLQVIFAFVFAFSYSNGNDDVVEPVVVSQPVAVQMASAGLATDTMLNSDSVFTGTPVSVSITSIAIGDGGGIANFSP